MKRVISYIRFSSERQAKGDSLRRQSKMVNDWLKAHPEYYLDQDLSFRDLGVSGFTGKHLKGGLGDFLTAIEKGLVKAGDTLLIESLDRLSRQAVDRASELLRNILRSGVDVVTLSDGEHYTSESLKDPLALIKSILNRPGFPGECFICELRLPDHRFRWKHNKLFLLLPEEYGPAFPAIVDCYTSPPT